MPPVSATGYGGPNTAAGGADLIGVLSGLTAALTQLTQVMTQLVAIVSAQQGAAATTGGGAMPGGAVPTLPPDDSNTISADTPPADAAAPADGSAPASGEQPRRPSTAREGLLLIGDSLSVGTQAHLNSDMAGQPVDINATGGISLQEGMKRYHETADKPRVVAMALFTNNDPKYTQVLRDSIQETINDARERGGRVLWATLVRPPVNGTSIDEANNIIRELAAANPDVMGVVDWQKMVADNPSYLAGDQIHATSDGYRARAQAFADAAKA